MDQDVSVLSAKLQSLHQDVGEIKKALGSLTEAITKLALIEERQIVTNHALERAFSALEKLESRITALEKEAPINKRNNIWVDRFVTGSVVALAALTLDLVSRNVL